MSKAEIKTLKLRIQSLSQFIEIETNPVAAWNLAKDLAQAKARLEGAR